MRAVPLRHVGEVPCIFGNDISGFSQLRGCPDGPIPCITEFGPRGRMRRFRVYRNERVGKNIHHQFRTDAQRVLRLHRYSSLPRPVPCQRTCHLLDDPGRPYTDELPSVHRDLQGDAILRANERTGIQHRYHHRRYRCHGKLPGGARRSSSISSGTGSPTSSSLVNSCKSSSRRICRTICES